MYKEVLRSIEHVGLYPSITLVVFVLFFTTVFLWVLRIRREDAEHMAGLPLHDGARDTQPLSTSAEAGELTHG